MDSEIQYIVYGPLRSGTTLLRLMLDHHPAIANAGEFDYLFDNLRVVPGGVQIDRQRLSHIFGFQHFGFVMDESLDDNALLADLLRQVTAKRPGVQGINIHRDLDHVLHFLPNAKVVKLHRDPRDVARSSMPMGWGGTPYYGARHWFETEHAWERARAMLPEDRALELRFEDLVTDPERELGRICTFLGVPFDPAMFGYANNSTYEPVDASIAFKWKKTMSAKDAGLVASRDPALVARLGYEVPNPPVTPDLATRIEQSLRNKIGVWKHQINVFGLDTMVLEKLTRWLRLNQWHGRIMDERINPRVEARIK